MIGIIYRPIVTEKSSTQQEHHKYSFEVDARANKVDIARAIEKKFNVTVVNVHTMNYKGKSKTQMTRRGRFTGKTSHFKKAVITIQEGQKIELFENA